MQGTIHGRVVSSRDGTPVSQATIKVIEGPSSAPEPNFTDESGFFLIGGLLEGSWVIGATAQDGATGTASVYVFDNAASELTIELEGPQPPDGSPQDQKSSKRMSGRTEPALASDELRGRVLGPDGAPLADVSVMAIGGAKASQDIAAVTDTEGHFFLNGLSPGRWTVRAVAPSGLSGEVSLRMPRVSPVDIVIEPGEA